MRVSTCAALLRMKTDDATREQLLVTLLTSLRAHSAPQTEPDSLLIMLEIVDLIVDGTASLAAASGRSISITLLQVLLEYGFLLNFFLQLRLCI